jgi:hypothetical protein
MNKKSPRKPKSYQRKRFNKKDWRSTKTRRNKWCLWSTKPPAPFTKRINTTKTTSSSKKEIKRRKKEFQNTDQGKASRLIKVKDPRLKEEKWKDSKRWETSSKIRKVKFRPLKRNQRRLKKDFSPKKIKREDTRYATRKEMIKNKTRLKLKEAIVGRVGRRERIVWNSHRCRFLSRKEQGLLGILKWEVGTNPSILDFTKHKPYNFLK